MIIDSNKKRSPPYVSFRSFLTLVEELQRFFPSRIDRSYWEHKFSGGTGTQLMSALRFLNLIDSNGAPSNQLKELINSKGVVRTAMLKKICQDSFTFLVSDNFDPEKATYSQLEEMFNQSYGVNRDVARKCIKFFVELAAKSEIPLSPSITKKPRSSKSSNAVEKIPKKIGNRTNQNMIIPQSAEYIPHQASWKEMIISKFPNFDPAWPTDVQLKWFEAFDELLKRGWNPGGER